MKNLLLSLLLLNCLGAICQNSANWKNNYGPIYAVNPANETLIRPVGALSLVDRSRPEPDGNSWMSDTETVGSPEPGENFSSLLLAKQLTNLDQTTPFRVSHNPTLERFIRVYLKYRKETLSNLMGKASYYFPVFEEYLDKYDLPLELKYLAVVESALNPTAVSTSGAKGLWQFTYGTGTEYGLYIDSYVDERYDYLKSTEAACAYLSRLYATFGDWDLALAAFNSGPTNVKKALQRAGGSRDYWEIRQYLPKETQGYLPAFYATLYLFTHSDYHGIGATEQQVTYFETDTVQIKGPMTFTSIGLRTGIDPELLRTLNPQFKMEHIPYLQERKLYLTLPLQGLGRFLEEEENIYSDFRSEQTPVSGTVIPVTVNNSYEVQPGDNLHGISSRHGISLEQLKRWNGLQTNFLIEGQRLVVTDADTVQHRMLPAKAASAKTSPEKDGAITHTVREGETLYSISRRYGNIPVSSILRWNELAEANYIKPGTELKILLTNEDKQL